MTQSSNFYNSICDVLLPELPSTIEVEHCILNAAILDHVPCRKPEIAKQDVDPFYNACEVTFTFFLSFIPHAIF